MTQPVSNGAQINTGTEQMDGGAMANGEEGGRRGQALVWGVFGFTTW